MNMSLHQEIITFLETFPILQNEEGRKAVLLMAGLETLIPQLDFRGSARTYLNMLIHALDRFGSLPNGQLAILTFFDTLAKMTGQEGQQQLQKLSNRVQQAKQKEYTKHVQQTSHPQQAIQAQHKEQCPSNQVFICYAREDWEIASRLYDDLCHAGINPWMDRKNLLPGQKWRELINQAIRQSSYVIALLSSHSVSKRGFVQKELKEALDVVDELPPSSIFVIPVRLNDSDPIDERLRNLHWVDLFLSYDEGLTQILQVLCPSSLKRGKTLPQHEQPAKQRKPLPPTIKIRNTPIIVSTDSAQQEFGLTINWRPHKYIQNDYEAQGEVIVDHTTGLMWQKTRSKEPLRFEEAQKYIHDLNQQQFANYNDWRLPTIPELLSLVEPKHQSNGLLLNPIFVGDEQEVCWSADMVAGSIGLAWFIGFNDGFVGWYSIEENFYVRSVRS